MGDGWKNLERYWAKVEGGVRLWRQDFSESIPDGENERATWDTKCWSAARLPAWNLYWKCEAKYRDYTGNRHFKLVLRAAASPRGALIVMHEDEYTELLAKAKEKTPPYGGVNGGTNGEAEAGSPEIPGQIRIGEEPRSGLR